MKEQTTLIGRDGWSTIYADEFGWKVENDDTGETVGYRDLPETDERHVIANIDSTTRVRHRVFDSVGRAMRYAQTCAVLVESDRRRSDATYARNDDVVVISAGFEPVAREGTVVDVNDADSGSNSYEVAFQSDPFDRDSDEQRAITCDGSEMIDAGAPGVDVIEFLGMDDIIILDEIDE